MESGGDGLFDRFVDKQAQREAESLDEQKVTDNKRAQLHKLFASLSVRGPSLTNEHLDLFAEEVEIHLSSTTLIFAGFLRGVHMGKMEDPEIRTEVLGDRGVCLLAGSSLFGFHDYADGVAYIPPASELGFTGPTISNTARFTRMYDLHCKAAREWGAVLEATKKKVKFDGMWAAAGKQNTMAKVLAAAIFSSVCMDHEVKDKLESVTFDRSMRKAMDG